MANTMASLLMNVICFLILTQYGMAFLAQTKFLSRSCPKQNVYMAGERDDLRNVAVIGKCIRIFVFSLLT